MKIPNDYVDLLEAFERHHVEYVIVGGYALAFHGAPRFTKDIDIFFGDNAANLQKVLRALKEFGAPSSTVEAVQNLQGLDVAWMGNPPLRIDLMKQIPGVTFDEVARNAKRLELDSVGAWIISREDLMRAKAASGRPQDLVDIDSLKTD